MIKFERARVLLLLQLSLIASSEPPQIERLSTTPFFCFGHFNCVVAYGPHDYVRYYILKFYIICMFACN